MAEMNYNIAELNCGLMHCFKMGVNNLTSSPGITVVTIAVAITGQTTSSWCHWITIVTRSTAVGGRYK